MKQLSLQTISHDLYTKFLFNKVLKNSYLSQIYTSKKGGGRLQTLKKNHMLPDVLIHIFFFLTLREDRIHEIFIQCSLFCREDAIGRANNNKKKLMYPYNASEKITVVICFIINARFYIIYY